MIISRRQLGVLVLIACTGCGVGDRQLARADTAPAWRQAGDVVDSILPMEEYERRFRQHLTEVDTLAGGATSRDALASQVMDAIAARDSAALATLLISPAEFSWLVFPHHVYREEPYALDPAIFWAQMQLATEKGRRRLFNRYGGRHPSRVAVSCGRDTAAARDGLILWAPCSVQVTWAGVAERGKYFGSIVEHSGRYKLLSLETDL